MLDNVGAIIGILSGAIVIIVTIIGIAKSGFNIFNKINKIDNIEKGTNALLLIHRDELFALYKDQIKIVFNPTSSPYSPEEKNLLLEKLKYGYLTGEESEKLTEILKYEEEVAKQKDQQLAVLAIGALLLLIALASKK
jgi:hypothetical protein